MKFGTKAENLEMLSGKLKNADILPQIKITVKDWLDNKERVFASVKSKNWLNIPLVVRSSAKSEDGFKESMAGHYTSILNVKGVDHFEEAVNTVISSYTGGIEEDQVLIQPMLNEVVISGVAFSKDPNTNAPYVVINYDDITKSTSSVTAGDSNNLKTFYYYKYSPKVAIPDQLSNVIKLMEELETLFNNDSLDIEFAIDKNEKLYLFQVRPLIINNRGNIEKETHKKALNNIYRKIKELNRQHPYLLGDKTVYGIMPDWNPAEIIGVRPRPLALSLYKEIITDNIWAYQRHNYGYRNLRSFPLIVNFMGLPYVDVRIDFNSFVPADLEYDLADRLVKYYIQRLVEFPSYHDKVEFEIIFSCYTFDLPERLAMLRKFGFTEKDCNSFTQSLRSLTNKIINSDTGLWKKDKERIEELDKRRTDILDSSLDKVSQIYWLLEDCKRYGTLPFAGLARAAFIAVQLLKSLVNVGVLKEQEYQNFMNGLNTVSSELPRDFERLSRKAFLTKYGHLRPGTYDILSARYDEEPDRYFDWSKNGEINTKENEAPFNLSLDQLKKIESLLKEHGLEYNVIGLFDFMKEAIEGREYSKYIFTKNLSDSLSLFEDLCRDNGFTSEDASYADINCIRSLYNSSDDISETLRQSIEQGKKRYSLTSQLILPSVIKKQEDIWAFNQPPTEPNYITLKTVDGNIAFANQEKEELKDKILFIPSADPGYDWVFSNGIKGLVTMYGGVNSHMAIRAGEKGIPAVIGAGEILYSCWAKSQVVQLDCANKQVRVIR